MSSVEHIENPDVILIGSGVMSVASAPKGGTYIFVEVGARYAPWAVRGASETCPGAYLDREYVDRGVGRLLLLEDLLAEVVVARLDERVRRDRDLDALLEPLLEVDQLLPLRVEGMEVVRWWW